MDTYQATSHIIILSCECCTAVCITVRLHVMQRTVMSRPFCPSVRLSVCQTRALWQNESNLCPYSYTTWKKIYPSFATRTMVGGRRLLGPEILGQDGPVRTNTPIFNRYSFVAPQP